eukprot:917539-Rhodomonas_salina.1
MHFPVTITSRYQVPTTAFIKTGPGVGRFRHRPPLGATPGGAVATLYLHSLISSRQPASHGGLHLLFLGSTGRTSYPPSWTSDDTSFPSVESAGPQIDTGSASETRRPGPIQVT